MGLRFFDPENITSLIKASPRSDLTDCSPKTKRIASTILLLPDPLGPTIQVISLSKFKLILSANDLKPDISISFKYIIHLLFPN